MRVREGFLRRGRIERTMSRSGYSLILTLLLLTPLAAPLAEGGTPMEVGAPLIYYFRMDSYNSRPYLSFYPPTTLEMISNQTTYITLNSTVKSVRMLYPRVYMKTLYYRPAPDLPNQLNLSIKYSGFNPGRLRANVEIDLEGDGHYDLTYTYREINLSMSFSWVKVILNLTGKEGVEDWIQWGVVRLNIIADIPLGSSLAIACGADKQISSLLLPYRRASPNVNGDGGNSSKTTLIVMGVLLLTLATYIAWDIRRKRGG